MKRYDKYKESGIPWIGNIPEHWEVKKIRGLFAERREIVSDSIWEALSVSKDGVTPQLATAVKTDNKDNRKKVCKGDFVVNSRSDRKGSCGFSVYNGSVSLINIVLYPSSPNRISQGYYHYLLRSNNYIEEFYRNGRGIVADLWTTHYSEMRNIFLPLPPLSEQEAIVAYLEEKVAQMDSLAAKQEAQNAYLRELKQAIIARAVTQGLDPHAPLRPSGIPWIGAIPKHWKVQRLGRCFGENRALNSDLECTEAYKFNYGSLIRKDENINPQELVDTYTKYTLLRENDIIINGLNLNYDFVTQRVAIATQKGIITSAYLILSPRKGINHNYYCLLFKAMDSMRLFHGMGSGIRLTLSYKDLKNQWLPFPPPSEQEAIVTHINRKTEEIDRLIAMTEQEIARVRELKQTLIADVVTGRINVQPS